MLKNSKPKTNIRDDILTAVDQLRSRKSRPDKETIAHYVLRKFGYSLGEIFSELENIVDDGGLVKVAYKGHTSYRTLASMDVSTSPLLTKHSKILNSSKTSRLITSAVNELLAKDESHLKSGVPLSSLKELLKTYDPDRFSDTGTAVFLDREFNCGNLKLLDLPENKRVFPKDIDIPEELAKVTEAKKPKTTPSRTTTRKRKSRESNAQVESATESDKFSESSEPSSPFDSQEIVDEESKSTPTLKNAISPSPTPTFQLVDADFVNKTSTSKTHILPEAKQNGSSTNPTDPPPIAKKSKPSLVKPASNSKSKQRSDDDHVVQKVADAVRKTYQGKLKNNPFSMRTEATDSNGNGSSAKAFDMIKSNVMSDADASGENDEDDDEAKNGDLPRSKRNKRRRKVFDPSDSKTIRAFSTKSRDVKSNATPQARDVVNRKSKLLKQKSKSEESNSNANASRSVKSSNARQESGKTNVKSEKRRESLREDVTSWSCEDVEAYFVSKNLKDEGAVLRKEKVDGLSLVLLQRNDVINGLGLRVGPALKVYRLVYELQTKNSERLID